MMAKADALRPGFTQTCWRGLAIAHPAEWEAARLSDQGQPNQLSLVDRRYQRLEAHWQVLKRPPNLDAMYERLGKSLREHPHKQLLGQPEWRGLVQDGPVGQVVHAGRFFPAQSMLVELVLIWPQGRDQQIETAILRSVAPTIDRPVLTWRALGLHVELEREFDLTEASSHVGRVCWTFERAKPALWLTIERLAMGKFWLKNDLPSWLAKERPEKFRPINLTTSSGSQSAVDAGHQIVRLDSQWGGRVARLFRRAQRQVDFGWLCSEQERVYRLVARWPAHRPAFWPESLLVSCCRSVRIKV